MNWEKVLLGIFLLAFIGVPAGMMFADFVRSIRNDFRKRYDLGLHCARGLTEEELQLPEAECIAHVRARQVEDIESLM